MNINVKIIFAVALGVLLLVLPSAQAATANAPSNLAAASTNAGANLNATMTKLFGDPVIAKGKGFEIKQSDLDDAMSSIRAALAAHGQTVPAAKVDAVRLEQLNRLIGLQLLLQKATAADRANGKQEFEKALQEIKTNQKLTDAEFDQKLGVQLRLLGMTKEQWDKQNIDQATAVAVLKRELNVKVTDAEAKKFYDEHPAEFEVPERVRVEQLFLSTHDPATGMELSDADKAAKKKKMEDILKQARAGVDFEKLVKQFSDDPSAKESGGEITIARGRTPPTFEAAAFSLNTNQISDVVTTASGYYIIKLLEKLPARKLDFDSVLPNQVPPNALKVSDYIETLLTNQKVAKLAQPYLATLRKEAGVEILDPDLKAAEQQEEADMGTNAPAAPTGE